MRKLKVIFLSAFICLPSAGAWATSSPVPEISSTGTLAAFAVVAAIFAIIAERRQK